MLIEPVKPVLASGIQIKWATESWEKSAAAALRRRVFCEEQQVFEEDDRDAVDTMAIPLVAVSLFWGAGDEVVGTVRIHRDDAESDTWWGSRLAVDQRYRRFGRIGADLIRLAVSSAHARGCRKFLANVQSQNVPLFRRLHWRTLDQFDCHGRSHHRMEADLAHFPPFDSPELGFFSLPKIAA